jgi:hypothetical protein
MKVLHGFNGKFNNYFIVISFKVFSKQEYQFEVRLSKQHDGTGI